MSFNRLDSGVFMYNGRQVYLVKVVKLKREVSHNTATFSSEGEYVVTYLPSRGYVKNIATGELYQYFTLDNSDDENYKTYNGKAINKDVMHAVRPILTLTDDEMKEVKKSNSDLFQRTALANIIDNKMFSIIDEWIKMNCESHSKTRIKS